MNLQSLNIKVFAEQETVPDFEEFVPVFHSWIQQEKLDELLIDVADYAHVPGGPGVMLIAHKTHYGVEFGPENRFGLQYTTREQPSGSNVERVQRAVGKTLTAAGLLESETTLQGRLTFSAREFRIAANSRKDNPNDRQTFELLQRDLQVAFDAISGVGNYELKFIEDDSRERFTVYLCTNSDVPLTELLNRTPN